MKRLWRCFKRYRAVAIFIGIWELATMLEVISPHFLPPFSQVVMKIWELLADGELPRHIAISLIRSLSGFVVSGVIAIPLGVLLSCGSRNFKWAVRPVIEFFSQANPFLFFHIILLFLGIGEVQKVTVIAWTCTWPVLYSTLSGIQNADPQLIKVAAGFGLNKFQLLYKVLLPSAVPSILTGLRLSAGYSLLMLIAAEMMGGYSGLGWMIVNSQEIYDLQRLFAAVVVIAFFSVMIDGIMKKIERKAIFIEATH